MQDFGTEAGEVHEPTKVIIGGRNFQPQGFLFYYTTGGIAPPAEYDRGRIAAETVECLAFDLLNGLAPEQRANGFAGRIAFGADEKSEHGIIFR